MENPDTRTYRYKFQYWFLFIAFGSMCLLMVAGILIKNGPRLLAGKFDIWDLSLPIFLVGFLAFGLLSWTLPFVAKIVLSPQGIEFHGLLAVMKADWSDAQMGVLRTQSGLSETLICPNAEIKLRKWGKYATWDVAAGMRELGIPFGQFGGSIYEDVLENVRQYAPPLTEDDR